MTDHLESSIFGEHDDHPDVLPVGSSGAAEPEAPQRRPRRRSVRRSGGSGGSGGARRSKPSIWRRLVVIVLALAVVGGGATVAYVVLRPMVEGFLESNDYPGPGEGKVSVTVVPGAGGSAIADLLVTEGVVKTSKAFNDAAAANDKAAGIQPGVYTLKEQMKASDALALLVDPANRVINRVVIPEGLWATEIYAKLSKQTGIPVASYTAAAKDGAALGLPSSAKGKVEGYLFPASYEFDPGSSARDQLRQMVGQSTKRLAALGITPDKMERVVIVASLVEAEASRPADRPKVARVVENRLADGMRLQLDSTVSYAAGRRSATTTNQERASNSPYNTYKVAGLPAGPISNPGESAIEAAAKPAAGDWTYFVTVNPTTGETKFTNDYKQHLGNVKEFQAWCQANKGKC